MEEVRCTDERTGLMSMTRGVGGQENGAWNEED